MEGSILLRWVIWHVPFFFACRAQDYTFCVLIVWYMLSDKIKDKSALKARTFLNVRDKVHVCYWYWLSMYLSTENSAGYQQHVQILKTLHWRILPIRSIRSIEIGTLTWISFVTDIKQTCLGQGLGVTITARKRPSKLMHVHHEGLRSYAAWSSKLNIDDITLKKSHTNHSVKQLSKFAK